MSCCSLKSCISDSDILSILVVNSCSTPSSVAKALALKDNLVLTNLSKGCVPTSYSLTTRFIAFSTKAFLYASRFVPVTLAPVTFNVPGITSKEFGAFIANGSNNLCVILSVIPPISLANLEFSKSLPVSNKSLIKAILSPSAASNLACS